ncbi:hypothetical protein I350_02212 [Cryptococcus amylolentus CBS 6273]|uniref:JmjC domain-containing protein n=1 Tax=Cryptococcus amylolentus CBS 6273 TaxID=1296118 RepID=A0A1E3K9Y3_9TREE|nr:hypothetical protein I350_02212 [Cryptococcus amylolentus CBS 6273]
MRRSNSEKSLASSTYDPYDLDHLDHFEKTVNGDVPSRDLRRSIEESVEDYYDMAPREATIMKTLPSDLEALRMIHNGHPCVIKGFSPLSESAEGHDWSKSKVYEDVAGDKKVTVAVTDDGWADSVRTLPNGRKTFVKALDAKMTIKDLVSRLGKSPIWNRKPKEDREAYYLQSQDGNIYRDTPHYSGDPEDLNMFQEYIKRDVEWMKGAVGRESEAVNLWIGDSRSTTSLHHDPFENIYHVLAGSKIFTLLPPIETAHLKQRFYAPSTLQRDENNDLVPVLDPALARPSSSSSSSFSSSRDGPPKIPWVASKQTPKSSRKIRVTLKEGETLYLPAGWWHRVEQEEGDEGLVVAVNYWYHHEIHPAQYAHERLFRRVAIASGLKESVVPPMGDEVADEIYESDPDGEE